VQGVLRLRSSEQSPSRNRDGGLGLTVFPQKVQRLQETEMWTELCPSAKGAILLYNHVQGNPI
jgi:hypothetical protein